MKKIMLLALCLLSTQLSCQELVNRISSVKPSVVAIAILNPTASPRLALVGTGFVVGDGTQIATNAHVVGKILDDAKNEQYVVLSGQGNTPKIHLITKQTLDTQHDLAVLKINAALTPLPLARDDYQPEGTELLFTGFPITDVLGLYPASNKAMISAVTPIVIPMHHSSALTPHVLKQLQQPFMIYQLDGTAYPGNSGSPVYRIDDGTVVAIMNMVYVKSSKEAVLSDPSGISYAIPSKHLRALLARTQ